MARKREIVAQAKKTKTPNVISYDIQKNFFIEDCISRNLKESSIAQYNFFIIYFQTYLKQNNHTMLVDMIEESDIQGFISYLRNQRRNQQSSINSAIRHLRPFFNYMTNKKVITINPMANIKKGKEDQKPIIPFTHEQVQKLLKTPDKTHFVGFRDVCIMLVLCDTGMRISECLNIRYEDINFETGSIILKTTKNRTSRVVGIGEPVRKEIKRFIKSWLPAIKRTDYIFQSYDGEHNLSIRTFQENFKEYGIKANIEGVRVSPHTARHYFAINFLKNGGSTSSLRTVLGHIDLKVVEKYLYWSDSEVVEQNIRYSPMNQLNI